MTTVAQVPRTETLSTEESDRRDRWVAAYRQTWSAAGRWAAGGAVSHAIETQDRVFRMAEQLLRRGILATRTAVFEALIIADRAVQPDAPDGRVVEAGWRAYKAITGRGQSSRPVSLLLSGGMPVDVLCAKFRMRGYEPVIFDGRDPAAYAWAIFEMEQRLLALKDSIPADGETEPGQRPFGITVTTAPTDQPARR